LPVILTDKMRTIFALTAALAITATAQAQFEIQDSHTTASFRGIHSIGNGVAWASGTEGTVLRTTDEGATWQRCTTPPDAEKLDFRGIQAFDQNTAIVMSSGKGDLSRLYKTTDGCKTWKLVFTNPDKDGFWDAIRFPKGRDGILLGDPVDSHFPVWRVGKEENTFQIQPTGHRRPPANKDEAAFAASNSSVFVEDPFFYFWIATGGMGGSRVIRRINHDFDSFGFDSFPSVEVPVGQHSESSGIFSLNFRPNPDSHAHDTGYTIGVAAGGDYKAPNSMERIAAWTDNGGKHWTAATQQPHGYRSSVAYDTKTKTWITTGPNGTDISRDDGRNWTALKPGLNDAPDADKNWNALSLPFVVGPKGRIGKLRPDALKH
jgi:photosystem II stability/assembly factor-like uncharacterized protein